MNTTVLVAQYFTNAKATKSNLFTLWKTEAQKAVKALDTILKETLYSISHGFLIICSHFGERGQKISTNSRDCASEYIRNPGLPIKENVFSDALRRRIISTKQNETLCCLTCTEDFKINPAPDALVQFRLHETMSPENYEISIQMSVFNAVNIAKNLIALGEALHWEKLILTGSDSNTKELGLSRLKLQHVSELLKKRFRQVSLVWLSDNNNFTGLAQQLQTISNSDQAILGLLSGNVSEYLNFLGEIRLMRVSYRQILIFLPSYRLHNDILHALKSDEKGLFEQVLLLTDTWHGRDNTEDKMKSQIPDKEVGSRTSLYLNEVSWMYITIMKESWNISNRSMCIKGVFEDIFFDNDGIRLQPFVVKIVHKSSLEEILKLQLVDSCRDLIHHLCNFEFIAQNIRTHHITKRDDDCELNPELCDNANQTEVVVIIAGVMIAIVMIIAGLFLYRKLKIGESSQMPWAIPYDYVKIMEFNPANSTMSVHSIQPSTNSSQMKAKNLDKNLKLATVGQAYVTVSTYALKERIVFDRADITLLCQIKQSIHDNINPFVGVCFERTSELFIMWRHCFRSTLANFIFENEATEGSGGAATRSARFEDDFRSSFVRDIIRGLDYLHSSQIGYHGSLTTSHCLINNHWILKLSGFGLLRLVYKWKKGGTLATVDHSPVIKNSEIYYYAPELLNWFKMSKSSNLSITNQQGQAADLYAFGIILYEMIFHKRFAVIDEREQDEYEDTNNDIFDEAAQALIPNYMSLPNAEGIHPNLLELVTKCCSRTPELRPDATLTRKITDATLKKSGSLVDQMIRNMEEYTNNLEVMVKERTRQLEEAQQHAERLLLELLPVSVATELKAGRTVEAKVYKSVTIMYSDIVGFTSLCSESLPMEVVRLLNGVFRKFDMFISANQCYKVETIGDAYMVSAGIPEEQEHHACHIALTALQMRKFLQSYEIPHRHGQKLHCRWGFNSGPVFSGVVGLSAPRYCIFGETTLLASKMENKGMADRIQTTFNTYKLLTDFHNNFELTPRGSVCIEGFGTLLTYWLDGVQNECSKSIDRKT